MIVFDLQCGNGHNFEGWFNDGLNYEEQKKKSMISCPVCNDTCISKVPSAFAIKSSQPEKKSFNPQMDFLKVARKIADFVENNFDDVGTDFTKEALKIHCGVSEPRNIKGVSTTEEEKILKDEGVEFFKIPIPQDTPPDTDS